MMSNVNITSKNPRINQPKLNSTILDIKEVKNLKNYFKNKGGIDSNHALTEKMNTQKKDSNFTYNIYLGTPQGSTLDFCSEKRRCVQGFAEYLYENNIKGTQQFAVSTDAVPMLSVCDDTVLHGLSDYATNHMFPAIVGNSLNFYLDNRPPYVTDILYLSRYREETGNHVRVESEYPFDWSSWDTTHQLELSDPYSDFAGECDFGALIIICFGSVTLGILAFVGLFEIATRCERRWRNRAYEREQENNSALAEAIITEPAENSQSNYIALDNIDSQNIETNNGLDPNKC